MKRILSIALAGMLASASAAQEAPAMEADPVFIAPGPVDLSDFAWRARPLIVFADTDADPRFIQQMEMLHERPGDLAQRDVVVLTDTDPDSDSALRRKLRPRGFMLVLIGKDGVIYLRKPSPWSVREISRNIDKLPTRQEEIRERRLNGG